MEVIGAFREGPPPNAFHLWVGGNDQAKIQILDAYCLFLKMRQKLKALVYSRPNYEAWRYRFVDLMQEAPFNTRGLVDYFDIRPNDRLSDAIHDVDNEDLLIHRVLEDLHHMYPEFDKQIAADLSKPDAMRFFEKWHRHSPLAVRVDGKLVPTMIKHVGRGYQQRPVLGSILRRVDFETNMFVAWPQPLKEAVYVNLTERTQTKVDAMRRLPPLKALAFSRLSLQQQNDIRGRHDAGAYLDWT